MAPQRRTAVRHLLAWSPVVAVLAVALLLRLDDPLSSPVIPAEDPYTHMALVREHLADGKVQPLNPEGGLYPPGFHAAVAAAWVFGGAELEPLIRFGPALLGVVGVLGMALLAGRHEGPVGAFVAALAYAVMPEAVFRTTMMAPTALDLAILPYFLYALVELVRGTLAWGLPVAALGVFVLFSHPWLLAILALAGVLFMAFALVLPWREPPPLDPRGLAIAILLVATPAALSLTGCTGWCGGFDFVVDGGAQRLAGEAPLIVGAAVLAAGLLGMGAAPLRVWLARDRSVPSRTASALVATVLAAGIGLATWLAVERGMPSFVDLPRMFGWPILALAALGLVVAPFTRRPMAHLGVAIVAGTYPFVVFNPLDSEFWPHRTAVYLGVGLALLCGVGAAQVVRSAGPALARALATRGVPRAVAAAAAVAALLVCIPTASALYFATPAPSDRPWYRLYDTCGDAALHDVASLADAAPDTLVVAGSWQAKLVLAAYATDASRTWFTAEFFRDTANREGVLQAAADRPVLAVVDPHFRAEHPSANLTFLERAPWSPVGTWCAGNATLSAYTIPR